MNFTKRGMKLFHGRSHKLKNAYTKSPLRQWRKGLFLVMFYLVKMTCGRYLNSCGFLEIARLVALESCFVDLNV